MVEIPCILPNSGLTEYLYTEASSEINTTHLGGLYNSIFPYDLSQITNAKDFHFSVELDSSYADIHIFLHTPTLGTQCIHTESIHSARSKLRIPLFEILPGQRLTASIQTPEPHSIVEAQWSFSSKHKSDVKLGVVICTYNNEGLLKKNISRLIDSSIWENSNIELLLSNNGILEDTSFFVSERCHRFDQQNVGGSGGFARGIYEILHGRCKSLGITHILLMDDDVEFHPEVIQRTINYHQRCVKPCVIGGSMLQLENPTWLHEAGCLVKSKSSIGTHTDITKGLLSETNALDQLGRAKSYDYNAWWFCSFPVDAARKVGLPLPLFIHGDDIEYGMRLKEHGYPVYCPGGISVWHQSFENKHLTWIRYFDFRNALIRITYHQRNSTKTLILQLMNACRRATIRNDYGGFIMALKAFEDFAKGPSVLHANDFKTQIKSLNTLYREFSGVEGIAYKSKTK
jgi:galactofuranosylgalactofuranosylrhamnosyl-N-acetylglucosaminyl-diphospho-decaprenol beta-1,5/1,6-galactofuranosyltransferase